MPPVSNKVLQRLVDAKHVLEARANYLHHKARDVARLARTCTRRFRLIYSQQCQRVLQLASATLEHAMIIDGLIDSVVNLRILCDYKITATLNRLCAASCEQALDQVRTHTHTHIFVDCIQKLVRCRGRGDGSSC